MRFKWFDNVGGYIRSPEPGCSFRPTGNFVGPYRFKNLEVDASVVMTNKSLTGPNRGYACGHLYFETEGMMDRLAEKLGLDPAEVRRRNLIPPDELPYCTPTGGYYDSGDYPKTLQMALDMARYDELRRAQKTARAAGKYFGIGLALAVDPSVSNMGYVATALDPQFRAKPEYLPKSGATESATVKVDPLPGHRHSRHDAPGPGPPDDRVADHRRRARAQAPGHHGRRRDGHVHTRVVDLLGDVLEPLRLRGHQRRGAGRTQAARQARRVRGAPDGRARQRRRVQGRRRQAEARQGPVLHREGSGWARPLEHGVTARRHGARAAGYGRVWLHRGQGRRRRGSRELVEHVRVHRRGHGRGGGPGHGADHDRTLRHRPRRGDHHQPDDRRGPDLRRSPARPRRRAVRGV